MTLHTPKSPLHLPLGRKIPISILAIFELDTHRHEFIADTVGFSEILGLPGFDAGFDCII